MAKGAGFFSVGVQMMVTGVYGHLRFHAEFNLYFDSYYGFKFENSSCWSKVQYSTKWLSNPEILNFHYVV